jgi:hypothetical protein
MLRAGLSTGLACEATGPEHDAGTFHLQRFLAGGTRLSLLADHSVRVYPRRRSPKILQPFRSQGNMLLLACTASAPGSTAGEATARYPARAG